MKNENRYHVIKDPIHGTMQFTTAEDNWIKPFIDHPHFQRLRHIKQLGMGDFIFPGAVHTRFNHSIGCCYIASQIGQKIGLAEEERQLVMMACLLHDIGHGPFSHAFEDIFVHQKIRHELWTPFFLAEFRQSNFVNHYNRRNPRHPLNENKFISIEEMIMHRAHTKNVLADMVSSQMDADRLDYLLRDSHFCGVRYGEFDFRWMLHCMAIIETDKGERLGLTHKGIGAVEHYLVARRLMTRNIYHHQKKLVLEFLLVNLLAGLAIAIENEGEFIKLKETTLGKFLQAVHEFNAKPAQDMNAFLAQHFYLYKELCDYDVYDMIRSLALIKSHHPIVQIAQRIQNRIMPTIVRIDHLDPFEVNTLLTQFKQQHVNEIQDWQLALIKNPHQSYNIKEDPILVINEQGVIKPIHELSLMINAISDKYENNAFLCIDHFIAKTKIVQDFVSELTHETLFT